MKEKQKVFAKVEKARQVYMQDRSNLDAKMVLADALLDQGRYEKFKRHNYEEASRMFSEVLNVDSSNPDAHYHMGFLAANDHRWRDACSHLELALLSGHFDRTRREKACGYLAAAYFALDEQEKAQQWLHLVKDSMNEGIEFAYYIKRHQQRNVSLQHEFRPYLLRTRDQETYLFQEQYENDKRTYESYALQSHNEIIFNMAGEVPVLRTARGRMKIDSKSLAMLLDLLMTSNDPISHSIIRDEVFGEQASDSSVRTAICRLREKIAPLFQTPIEEVICNIRRSRIRESAYQFCWDGPFFIYKKML